MSWGDSPVANWHQALGSKPVIKQTQQLSQHMPVIPALERLRQEGLATHLGYVTRPYL